MLDHPEIPIEQKYFDEAAYWREEHRNALGNAAEAGVSKGAAARIKRDVDEMLESLGEPDSAVAFGRMDKMDGSYYIGHHLITDGDKDALVISWKSPVAEAYYQATRNDARGVRRKRAFDCEGNTIRAISDDVLDEDADDFALEYPGMEDALLADLQKHRSGEMLEIARTIQAEQDAVLRRPLDRTLVVQGGPGTGKTAIGLHRASYLLYTYPHLKAERILVIGPNKAFMRYIQKVLPSLGDTAVEQLPVSALAPQLPTKGRRDSSQVRKLKGDVRMAALLRNAIRKQRNIPEESETIRVGGRTVELTPQTFTEVTAGLDDRPHNVARDTVRERLAQRIARQLRIQERDVYVANDFDNLIERLWPRLSPQAFLRDTYTIARRLREAADGVLAPEEADLLARPAGSRLAEEPWTESDYPLLDEALWLLDGDPAHRFGHVIVDEAQDLTPMQLRSIARRCSGFVTALGDLAQSTGEWMHDSWDDVVDLLPGGSDAEVTELDYGYRVPAQIFNFAARLLPTIAPDLSSPEPKREGPTEPTLVRVSEAEQLSRAVQEARQFAYDGNSVALIASEDLLPELRQTLDTAGTTWADALRDGPGGGITVVPDWAAKGLEFDAVVVVEPHRIARRTLRGLRLLYVALTRSTRHLSIVHSLDVPAELTGERQATSESRVADAPLTYSPAPDAPAADLGEDLAHAFVDQAANLLADRVRTMVAPNLWVRLLERLEEKLLEGDHVYEEELPEPLSTPQVDYAEETDSASEMAPAQEFPREIGVDEFKAFHKDYYKGIYVPGGEDVAVSIRFKPKLNEDWGYNDKWIEEGRILDYTGQGAPPNDQEWNRFNAGLRNACERGALVRVFEQLPDDGAGRRYRDWGNWLITHWYEQPVKSQKRTVLRFVFSRQS